MTITQSQTQAINELRTVGLACYAAMKSAEKAYADAQERERLAYQYAAEHGEFSQRMESASPASTIPF